MKLKFLFMCLLGAAVFVGCNNEIETGPVDKNGNPINDGESTTATFIINFNNPSTYAGYDAEIGSTDENKIGNIAMYIYKTDNAISPEAMAFVTASDNAAAGAMKDKITVKCKSGNKLIYVVANIGVAGSGSELIYTGVSATNSNAGNGYVGEDWTIGVKPDFLTLNKQIWSVSTGYSIADTTTGFTSAKADNIINAMTGNGVISNGAIANTTPANNYFLMSNWGNKENSDIQEDINTLEPYASTCNFKLIANISAAESQAATADATNNNGKNALLINIQRAVAKVSFTAIDPAKLANAGSGENAGELRLPATPKWALGNINKSEYPIQVWSGRLIQSTRFNETGSFGSDPGWEKKMDNSRFEGTGESYMAQNMTVMATLNAIQNTSTNAQFGAARVLATENNHNLYANQYSTFAVFGGQYRPDKYYTSFNAFQQATDSTTFPAQWDAGNPALVKQGAGETTDTMYYLVNEKMFFLGKKAIMEYFCFIKLQLQTTNPTVNPYTDPAVTAAVNALLQTSGKDQALLQAYYRGNCFYRIWIQDQAEKNNLSNKYLVRRNHIYNIVVSTINGPGIGDPNDIIDPDPDVWEPIEEADTWVTATLNVMKWHLVNQSNDLGID